MTDVLAKVELRGCLKSEVALAEAHLVDVHREDLRLGETALDLDCQQHLLELAAPGFLRSQEEHSRQLLGQRACSLGFSPLEQVPDTGANNTDHVNSPVVFKMPVLHGKDRVL